MAVKMDGTRVTSATNKAVKGGAKKSKAKPTGRATGQDKSSSSHSGGGGSRM